MANYNTFIVVDCKSRKSILITSSARKACKLLETGKRIDVWNDNKKIETIYAKDSDGKQNPMRSYIELEREYIRQKQKRAEERNKKRKFRRKLAGESTW